MIFPDFPMHFLIDFFSCKTKKHNFHDDEKIEFHIFWVFPCSVPKKTTRPGGPVQPVHPCQVETTGEATEAPPARASTEPGASQRSQCSAAAGGGESHGAGACAELGGTLQ